MRPKELSDIVGQEKLVGEEGILKTSFEKGNYLSFVLWGPPGTGKTTMAQVLAKKSGLPFASFSAVLSSMVDVKKLMEEARVRHQTRGLRTLLFIDEIHRFNKAQQDAFLPYVEKGHIILVGATTENPSFEVIGALLSRAKVFVVEPLSEENVLLLLKRALMEDRVCQSKKEFMTEDVLKNMSSRFQGDARAALNTLEMLLLTAEEKITLESIEQKLLKTAFMYDKKGEEHYNTISALHKSIRNSDVDASLYWLGRMLEAGEDPKYIVRRLIRFASEDIGNADPQALILSVATKEAVEFLGVPECNVNLSQLVIYLSCAPKSNSAYVSYKKVQKDLREGHVYPVPMSIRNAPTNLMKELDYGKNYQYAHDTQVKITDLQCLPDPLKHKTYYEPVLTGREKLLWEMLETRRKSLK